ncbi:MAG: FtsX-like permease family protein, partial [Thermoleophilaceae bacterium]|nr:FtsX-like permease family protein [Thermoleophilaceae bacterium]
SALGASAGRMVRQLLTESVLLALLGGGVGVMLAFWGVDALVRLLPSGFPRLESVRVDGTVLGFTLALSVLTGLLFGLAPALQGRSDPGETLREGGPRSTSTPGRGRARAALLVSQLALALMLLAGAGLLLRSFARLMAVDPGFDPAGVLTVELPLPPSRYADPEQQSSFYREVLERVSALPGVQGAATTLSLPLGNVAAFLVFRPEGLEPASPEDAPTARANAVSPGYFRTLRIGLARGRDFAPSDDAASPRVAIVNETLARQVWPAGDALGKRITMGPPGSDAPWLTIVGVARDVRSGGLGLPPGSELYFPYLQNPWPVMTLVVRTAVDPLSLVPAVRREVRSVDAQQPLGRGRTMEEVLTEALAPPRTRTLLLSAFAAMALVLSAVGIYGVASYSVATRTHEIGVRMALGARQEQVLGLVLRQGLRVAAAGIAAGLAGGLLGARFLTGLLESPEPGGFMRGGPEEPRPGMLYDVTALDPLAFAGAAIVLGLVAMLATYLPARRASRVDPLMALRDE